MNIYFYEDKTAAQFDPISLTRPVHAIRCGQKSFVEWNIDQLPKDSHISLFVRKEMENISKEIYPEYSINPDNLEDGIWVLASAVLKREEWNDLIESKTPFFKNDKQVACFRTSDQAQKWLLNSESSMTVDSTVAQKITLQYSVPEYLWEILPLAHQLLNDEFVKNNFSKERDSLSLINEGNISIDETAEILPQVVLNATDGPIIIEKNVKIYPFTYIQGPAFVGEGSVISPHTQFKNSYCGPMCKLGGEVSKTIIQGYSNKVHDGHLGDSFLGEWVNLGAGTTNSNLKNNYQPVSISVNGTMVNTNTLFAGLYIGDHSKTAIGTQFNTGTIVGPACNIVTSGLPSKYIHPFTWFINGKHIKTRIEKFFKTMELSMKRRNQILSEATTELYKYIYDNR
ncbi:MAG: hypothetical protein HQ509_04905 [Candidatus Marinimicrobia bacterium]|nr:hypothetical protein [Candidatus Neomarinimicrobiota bacterium]